MDSVTVRPDTLIIHQNGSDAVHAKSAVAKDTVFYGSDQFAFIREQGLDGKPAYFVGYVHRGDRKDWDDGLLIQVHPSRVVNASRHFVKTGMLNRMYCTAYEGRGKPAKLAKWDYENVTLGALLKLKGMGTVVGELPLDSRLIRELPRRFDRNSENGEAAWDGTTYKLREIEAINYTRYREAPIRANHLRFLKLTDDQMRQIGARPRK
jgi:hypothetical protein